MRGDRINDLWLKAAVTGGLWASLEVVIGSYVHNLHIPLGGTLMAGMGVCVLVAFHKLWPEKGLLWRAGLICALMKSLSPSAIILGPMIGIALETFLLEAGTRLLGANLAGYLAGGMLALLGALAQKLVRLLLVYGTDLARVAAKVCRTEGLEATGSGFSLALAVGIVAAVYMAWGGLSALAGFLLGPKSQVGAAPEDISFAYVPQAGKGMWVGAGAGSRQSLVMTAFHVIAVMSAMILLNAPTLGPVLLLFTFWAALCAIRYWDDMGWMRSVAFWMQILLVGGVAGLIWNLTKYQSAMYPDGWIVGSRMSLRAIVVMTGFSAISAELRNPFVETLMRRRGLTQLRLAAELAFSVLPGLVESLGKPGSLLRNPFRALEQLVARAEGLHRMLSPGNLPQALFVVSGDPQTGKTTFLKQVLARLSKQEIVAHGIIADGLDRDGRRVGFQITDLKSGRSEELCRENPNEGSGIVRQGRYVFSAEGLAFGLRALEEAETARAEIIVVDEIGKLELAGKGWASALDRLTAGSTPCMIWVVRRSIVDKVLERWGNGNAVVLDIRAINPDDAVGKIVAVIRKTRHGNS